MQKTSNLLSKLNWNDLKFFLEVSRTRTASQAARRLEVDYTTVSRKINALEKSLNTLLFEKSRQAGFILTSEGQALLQHAESIESLMLSAFEEVSGTASSLTGKVRIGCTEGLGAFFLMPQLAAFQKEYPMIYLDVLAVPHFVSLSKREADIAITLERPARGPYVSSKLCDYRLRLYASKSYLANNLPINSINDLAKHQFINYVEDLTFSNELSYLQKYISHPQTPLSCTGVIGQYYAALQGQHLAILPCFIAEQDTNLVPLLTDQVVVNNSFWISCREEVRQLKRIRVLWEYLKEVTLTHQNLFLGTK